MNKVLITYGDSAFEESKKRICREAMQTSVFDSIIPYGPQDITKELQESKVFSVKRGGGLWSWKPDIILKTMNKLNDGDLLFYCDAGCTLQKSKEWTDVYFRDLQQFDIRAIKIYQRNKKWIRKEIIDYFNNNPENWLNQFQVCATIAIKVTPFTRDFVKEWRNLMIKYPKFVMDVTCEEKDYQFPCFIENRHDQALYSALIYKYLSNGLICLPWEHIEGVDPYRRQAIIATRLKSGEVLSQNFKSMIFSYFKWGVKHLIYTLLK